MYKASREDVIDALIKDEGKFLAGIDSVFDWSGGLSIHELLDDHSCAGLINELLSQYGS